MIKCQLKPLAKVMFHHGQDASLRLSPGMETGQNPQPVMLNLPTDFPVIRAGRPPRAHPRPCAQRRKPAGRLNSPQAALRRSKGDRSLLALPVILVTVPSKGPVRDWILRRAPGPGKLGGPQSPCQGLSTRAGEARTQERRSVCIPGHHSYIRLLHAA